jgi:hypothetical protein
MITKLERELALALLALDPEALKLALWRFTFGPGQTRH